MVDKTKRFLEKWGNSVITLLVGFVLWLGEKGIEKTYSDIHNSMIKLNTTYDMAVKTRDDLAAHKQDAKEAKDRRDIWARGMDKDVKDLQINMGKVMMKDRISFVVKTPYDED